MKCPLSLIIKVYQDNTTMERLGDCHEAECAWWDIITERCAVKELAVQLRVVNANLFRLGKNMTLK